MLAGAPRPAAGRLSSINAPYTWRATAVLGLVARSGVKSPVLAAGALAANASDVPPSAPVVVAAAGSVRRASTRPSPLPNYTPREVEQDSGLYREWEGAGVFGCSPSSSSSSSSSGSSPTASSGRPAPFSQLLPPPNITGRLHLGHALTVAVEDALARKARMDGRPTSWIPGTDHAAIATQVVVERKLARDQGLTRHEVGRDRFEELLWEWTTDHSGAITDQLRLLGASLDWERFRFTLDPAHCAAVTEAFVSLHEAGLVFRDARLINWCPHLQTALSDLEVDARAVEGRTTINLPNGSSVEAGVLHRVAFALLDCDGINRGSVAEVVVETSRPETMLADQAVAVHADDPRYAHLVGATLVSPLTGQHLPIIADSEAVDPEFGTGAVKITPGHDHNDYAVGVRHSLSSVSMLDANGCVAPGFGDWSGMDRFEARQRIVDALTDSGAHRGVREAAMQVPVCSRSGDILEPLLRRQWFVRCDGMAAEVQARCAAGEIDIQPSSYRREWNRWLDDVRDWCVSRQLWWGHQIPAWRVVGLNGKDLPARVRDGNDDGNDIDDDGLWVVARTEAEARSKAVAALGGAAADAEAVDLERDEDVLDTWFSSAVFPLSTLGWPGRDWERNLYPLTVMETGSDILFFWVARMAMVCTQLTGVVPFETVLLHGMVRDASGRKMSKSLGNVVDPLWLVNGLSLEQMRQALKDSNLPADERDRAERDFAAQYPDGLPACGVDGLRLGLVAYTQQNRRMTLDTRRFLAQRRFCNKLWNATRFVLMHLDEEAAGDRQLERAGIGSDVEEWILAELDATVREVNAAFERNDLSAALSTAQAFFLGSFCDVYLEWSKAVIYADSTGDAGGGGGSDRDPVEVRLVLAHVLDTSLRLLHPFAPFVSETLWRCLPSTTDGAMLATARFPVAPPGTNARALASVDAMERAIAVVRAVRSARDTLLRIEPSEVVTVVLVVAEAEGADARARLESRRNDIERHGRCRVVAVVTAGTAEATQLVQGGAGEPALVQPVDSFVSVAVSHPDMAKYVGAQRDRLAAEQTKVMRSRAAVEGRLSNATFRARAPPDVQARDEGLAADLDARLAVIQETLERLEGSGR